MGDCFTEPALFRARSRLTAFSGSRIQRSVLSERAQRPGHTMHLVGARIGGNLSILGAEFGGDLNADSIQVGAHLLAQSVADRALAFKKVSITNAKVAANVSIVGATFTDEFDADRCRWRPPASPVEPAAQEPLKVNLLGAKVGGDVQFAEVTVDGDLNASTLVVGTNLHLSSTEQDKGKFKNITLAGAESAAVSNGRRHLRQDHRSAVTAGRARCEGIPQRRPDQAESR